MSPVDVLDERDYGSLSTDDSQRMSTCILAYTFFVFFDVVCTGLT